jgi:hypothetical protein
MSSMMILSANVFREENGSRDILLQLKAYYKDKEKEYIYKHNYLF